MQTLQKQNISDKWLKAAVLGSVWAAFEIITGSFLHNLRIPFAGMLLATASVFLLVSFMQVWRDRGIIIRAGLVCALMKSISPSAIILGPMLGIFMEALIIEAVVFLLGRHLFAFLLAGALATLWTLAQKILNLIILYGFDLVRIAEAFYQYLIRQFDFIGPNVSWLLWLILFFYALPGMLAAGFGFYTGRKYLKLKTSGGQTFQAPGSAEKRTFGLDPAQKYSFINIIIVIAAVVSSLYMLNRGWYLAALPAGTAFMVFCAIRYKNALRHLKKPVIWVQFLIVTLIAAIFWERIKTGTYFSGEGLRIGLEMNFRAMMIIFGFSAISVELRNPLIKTLLFRNGFSQLYAALNLAFSALPSIIDQLPRPRKLFGRKQKPFMQLLNQAEQLLVQFSVKKQGPKLFVVTGEVHEGKTTCVEKLIKVLRDEKLNVLGFLATGVFQDGERASYKLLNLSTNESIPYASAQAVTGWQRFRRFWFNPAAISAGKAILSDAAGQKDAIVVVDEVGPMELSGAGWDLVLKNITGFDGQTMIWVVRAHLLQDVLNHYEIKAKQVFTVQGFDANQAAKVIQAKNMDGV